MMMKFRVYYGDNVYIGDITIEGKSIQEIQKKTEKFFKAKQMRLDECFRGCVRL